MLCADLNVSYTPDHYLNGYQGTTLDQIQGIEPLEISLRFSFQKIIFSGLLPVQVFRRLILQV